MLKPQSNTVRQQIALDGLWSFRRDPEGEGERLGWSAGFAAECELAVPGSWNEQRADLALYFGRGWYQRVFTGPTAWTGCGLTVHFGSIQNHARVWLNGTAVGGHRGGHLPFECTLDATVCWGESNVLVVEVDASIDPWDLPPARLDANATHEGFHNSNPAITYDFFPYGGIPRPVSLQLTPSRARLTSIRVDSQVDWAARRADLTVTVGVDLPAGAPLEIAVAVERTLGRGFVDESGRATLRLKLTDIRLWDLGRPELYTARVELRGIQGTVDLYEQTFGLRHVEIAGDELRLNGRPIFLQGFGKHEDFPVHGRGLSLPVLVRDFDLLRWVGANSFRTSHYPYAEEWYEFADRHGVLVIGETPLVGLCQRLFESDEVLVRARNLVRETIARDRHHPSVIAWSVANEPWIESPAGERFVRTLLAEARSLDTSRPITYAAHMTPAHNAPCADCDFVSVNKYCGWYELPGDIPGGTARLGQILQRFRDAFGKPIMFAEFGADAIAGVHADPAVMFSEEFQAEILLAQIAEARRQSWVIGTHVWAFADYRTPQSITRAFMNHKGVFTRDRSPKLAAHALRKLWTQHPPVSPA